MKYLGAQIGANATVDSELSQKLDVAVYDFKVLALCNVQFRVRMYANTWMKAFCERAVLHVKLN